MKDISTPKSIKTDSPKTPGGISKSLLTPCRRVGLSRSWRKNGPSPFISPLSSSNSSTQVKENKRETRKRKERVLEEDKIEKDTVETPHNAIENLSHSDKCDNTTPMANKSDDIVKTPEHVTLPRKKKTKTLITAITDFHTTSLCENEDSSKDCSKSEVTSISEDSKSQSVQEKDPDSTHMTVISRKKDDKHATPLKNVSKLASGLIIKAIDSKEEENTNANEKIVQILDEKIKKTCSVKKSPNELTKECIVVIQNKLSKAKDQCTETTTKIDSPSGKLNKTNRCDYNKSASQTLFDSDDEMPLKQLSEKSNVKEAKACPVSLDDDFVDSTKKIMVGKLENKKTSTSDLKSMCAVKKESDKKRKLTVTKKPITQVVESDKPLSLSSNSFDEDDDDFDFENKTILIRKTYDKVTKPTKAKSVGSITQKDIDELKARIEMKKKLLLAKAMNEDTEELRSLIKKWQKGCQDALMELMDLMKNKFPDKQNMDYSEILRMLKIPARLVGYDSENDCFGTPDDATIILSKFND